MTIKEIIKQLINAEEYAQVRVDISDEFIDFVKEFIPSEYYYFAEKEQLYQDMIKLLKECSVS